MNTKRMYLFIRSMLSLAFNMSFIAAALYRIDNAQLEIYQLILIGTALEIAVFLFETPTGVVADMKSRRLSVIIGLFIIGVGLVTEILTTLFGVIFLAQIIWGLGYTFISGALDSWVTDELPDDRVEHIIISGAQANKLFAFIGIILAGVIGMVDVRFPIILGAVLVWIAGTVAILWMKEDHFHKHIHKDKLYKEYYLHLKKGLSHMRHNSVLRYMFVAMLFFGLYSEGIDRTFELNILDNLGFRTLFDIAPIWVITIVSAMIELSGLIILYLVKRYVKHGKHVVLWSVNFTLMMIGGLLLFAYVPNMYFALFGFLFFSFSREGTYPLLNSILIKNTPSHIKATVLSAFGQLDAIGQLLSGALMVGISILVGLQGMYLFTALLLIVPVIALSRIKD